MNCGNVEQKMDYYFKSRKLYGSGKRCYYHQTHASNLNRSAFHAFKTQDKNSLLKAYQADKEFQVLHEDGLKISNPPLIYFYIVKCT